MTKSRFTDLICIVITVFMIVITVLFMNGKALGVQAVETDLSADTNKSFSSRDLDGTWDESTAVYISLDDYAGLASGAAYELNGDLYLIEAGTYVLSGTMENHSVIVDADRAKVQIVLDNAEIVNEDVAPLYIKDADKVFITLAEGSTNTLSLTGELNEEQTEAGVNAAVYSRDDLSINGEGALYVDSALYNGIRSSDDLVITGGYIVVNAGENGIVGHDSLRICGGTFEITAGKDGLKANNDADEEKGYVLITGGDFSITAANDGIQAETDLMVSGGTFAVVTGNGAGQSTGGIQMPEGFDGMFGGDSDSGFEGMPDDLPEGFSGNMPGGFSGAPGGSFEGMPDDMPEGSDGFSGGSFNNMPGGFNGNAGNGFPGMPDSRPDGSGSSSTGKPSGSQSTFPGMQDNQTSTSTSSDSMKGLKAGNTITIMGGSFTLDCEDDAVHSDGSVIIEGGELIISSTDDGIHAEDTVEINGGTITVNRAYEGIEGSKIYVNDGTVSVTTTDDGFNAGNGDGGGFSFQNTDDELCLLEINGGTVYVNADGDGLDSNGDLIINGGIIIVDGPSDAANGALDSGTESGGELLVNGGTVLAVGSYGMAEGFGAESTQASIACIISQRFNAGDVLTIKDSAGNTVYEYTLKKTGSSVVFSDASLVDGEAYTVWINGTSYETEASYDTSSSNSWSMPSGPQGNWNNGQGWPGNPPGNQ